jgi:hypothetical protein
MDRLEVAYVAVADEQRPLRVADKSWLPFQRSQAVVAWSVAASKQKRPAYIVWLVETAAEDSVEVQRQCSIGRKYQTDPRQV